MKIAPIRHLGLVWLTVAILAAPSLAAPETAPVADEQPAPTASAAESPPVLQSTASPAADPAREARMRTLEQRLQQAQRVIGLMQAELEALKQGQPSPLPLPPAPAPPEPTTTARAPTAPPPEPEPEYAEEEEAPSPEQDVPQFTPGFLRAARAVLIREGMLEIDPRLGYTHNSRNLLNVAGLDIIEAVFVGRFEIGKVKRDQLRPSVSFRYGFSERLQFNLDVPYVYSWSRRYLPPQIQRVPNSGSDTTVENGGIGDITFGFSYHLWRESELLPDIIFTTSIKTNTGDGPFDVDLSESTTGTGFWGGSAGLTFVKVTDPGVLYSNLGYFYHQEDTFGGTKIDPADSIGWGAGYSWSLNPFLSLNTNVSGRFVDKTEVDGLRLEGSEQTLASLSLGLTYAYERSRTVDFALGFGLTEDSPDFSLAISMPFTFQVGNVFDYIF